MKDAIKKIIIGIIEWEARMVLRKYDPYVVAVTGNVGKTSAKEAVYATLSSQFHTRKSVKSFNSEIGVPLTILGCPTGWSNPFIWFRNIAWGLLLIVFPFRYPRYLVLEVGADRPGDIKRICSWLIPDVGVVTAFGDIPVHIEYFSSKDELVAEKSELIKALPSSGKAVLNADDADVSGFHSLFEGKPLLYGFSPRADVRASHYTHTYDKDGAVNGFTFKIDQNGSSIPFSFREFVGHQHVYALLAGAAVGFSQGMHMIAIQESLRSYAAQAGRMRLLKGKNGSVLIDDSYNASPAATKAAFAELEAINTDGRKIAIVGDMLELGKYTHSEHVKMGKRVFEIADIVVTVGPRARCVTEAENWRSSDHHHFSDSLSARDNIPFTLNKNDVVLIKGSQGARMEHITEALLDDPSNAQHVLVRQEKHWKGE